MDELTEREHKMLKALVNGASNKDLMRELGIALRTVELCRQRLMSKVGAKTATQLGYKYAKLAASEKRQADSGSTDAKPSRSNQRAASIA